MNRRSILLAIGLVLGLTLSAQAQFSFGFGTGGGGSGFYFGRGGMYYGSPYFGPSYYGPGYYGRGYPYGYPYGYGSGIGIRIGPRYYEGEYDYGPRGYRYAPSYRYDSGRGYYYGQQAAATYALPSNRVDAAAQAEPDSRPSTPANLQEGDILLRSPADAPAAVGYGINDHWVYSMKPGQKQKLAAGRDWTIEFDRGIEGADTARYLLSPGIYQFSYSEETGWDLHKERADTADDLLLPPEAPPAEESSAPLAADEN